VPAPAESEPAFIPGSIVRVVNLACRRFPQKSVAQRAPGHHHPSHNQAAIGKLPDLFHNFIGNNQDCTVFAPHRKLGVPREQDTVLLSGKLEEEGIFF
jgi:hypothetical protein